LPQTEHKNLVGGFVDMMIGCGIVVIGMYDGDDGDGDGDDNGDDNEDEASTTGDD
jgi:hypothetical protein